MSTAAQNADMLFDLATSKPYTGPPVPGPTLDGWPLAELVKILPMGERAAAMVELQRRFPIGSLYPHGGFGAGAGGFGVGAGGGFGGGAGGIGSPITPPSAYHQPYTLEEMMAARMGWGKPGGPWAVGFKHMAMESVCEKVHVWIITTSNESIVLEDERSLYPSDALITKIRML